MNIDEARAQAYSLKVRSKAWKAMRSMPEKSKKADELFTKYLDGISELLYGDFWRMAKKSTEGNYFKYQIMLEHPDWTAEQVEAEYKIEKEKGDWIPKGL